MIIEAVFGEQFTGQLTEITDRTLGNLREEGYKQKHLEEIFLCSDLLPVDIDQIAHGLEGVEGNTQGDDQTEGVVDRRIAEGGNDPVDLIDHKVQVFKYTQQTEVEDQGQHKETFPCALHALLVGILLLLGGCLPVGFDPGLLFICQSLDPFCS